METIPKTLTVDTLLYYYEQDKFDFTHPTQRQVGQWNLTLESEFIESILLGLPVHEIFCKPKSNINESFYVIDGSQRVTTLYRFYTNKIRLKKGIPAISVNGTTFNISHRTFEELPKPFQKKILVSPVVLQIMTGIKSERETFEIFRRLNSGVPLTKPQNSISKIPIDILLELNNLENNIFWEKANLSERQRKGAYIRDCLLQTLALMVDGEDIREMNLNYKYNIIPNRIAQDPLFQEAITARLKRAIQTADMIVKKPHRYLKLTIAPYLLYEIDCILQNDDNNEILSQFSNWFKDLLDGYQDNIQLKTYNNGSTAARRQVLGKKHIFDNWKSQS